MKTLITGGAGFIGSNLAERLLLEGHQVTVIDNLITGRLRNVEPFMDDERFHFLEVDLAAAPIVDADAIFHLASPASPVGYGRYPLETLHVNAMGTWRALQMAVASRARFLLASTSEVYGDPLQHPQPEEYFGNVDPVGPRSCYDEGKRFAEALTVAHIKEMDVDARIVRIFNCYGPRNRIDDGRMVPTFAAQALRNEPLTVHGDGSQTRSLCYVDDVVEGLMRAMFREGTSGRVYNLGQPREHSVLEFASLIIGIAGSASTIVHLPPREGEIERRKPDVRRAQQELGWTAATPLEEGLARTINWYRGELRQEGERAVTATPRTR